MIAALVEAALRSLLVALAVWTGLQAFRVRNVLAQKSAWGLVLAAAFCMPMFLPVAARLRWLPPRATVILPSHPLALLTSFERSRNQSVAPKAALSHAVSPVPIEPEINAIPLNQPVPRNSAEPHPDRFPAPVISRSFGSASSETAPPQPSPRRWTDSPITLAWLLYLAVSLALVCRLFYGLAAAFFLWQSAKPVMSEDKTALAANLPLRASPAVSSPVTVGSGVVLPDDYATWDSEKLRIVLAHERSHIRQGDFYLQLLSGLYAAVFWFSPLGWWLKRKLSDLAEAISDRAGLEQAASRSAYAQVLLEFAAAPRPTFIGVAMARNGSLSRRIERLLNDTSFRQAFAGNRLRALLAVLLVPVALFAATALIRVEAASQAPQQPAPQAEPSAPAQPASAPQPGAPVTGQSHPDQAPDAAPAPPPATSADQAAPAPPSPAMPPPSADVIAPAAPIGPGPDVIIEAAPGTPPPPVIQLDIPNGDRRSFVIARARQTPDGNEYSFHSSNNGDSYAVITGDQREHMTLSGDIHTGEIDKARALAHGDFLWFTRNGKSYFVDDPAIVAQIRALYKPMEELGRQQEVLGRQQDVLGKQQQTLSHVRVQAIVPAPDISKEMAELNEAVAKMQATVGKTLTQEELAKLQAVLGELQARLGALRGEMGAKQFVFVDQEAKLGAEEGALGKQEGKLGAEQGRMAAETDQKVRSIIDQSLKNGTAHPVQ